MSGTEITALFERLMDKYHSNSPRLYYGFKIQAIADGD